MGAEALSVFSVACASGKLKITVKLPSKP